MKQKWPIIAASIFLILLSPILFRKRTIPLVSDGKIVAVAKRPIVMPWDDELEVEVFVGKTKLFGLWNDAFDGPVYIYPFRDGEKFLCDFNDDTAILVFVVDFSPVDTNALSSTCWPSDNYVRSHLAARMTNVVVDTKGVVRPPTYSELLEVSSNLASMSLRQLKAASFPWCDLGIYKTYASRGDLLSDLATNRQSVW